MRLRHFEELGPVCPRCRTGGLGDHPLLLAVVERRSGDDIIEGILHCTNAQCMQEFPVIDGIPIIVPDVAQYINDFLWHITARDDLSAALETLLGDAAGPSSAFDSTRFHISSYAHDHWGEFDPEEASTAIKPGAVARCLNAGLDLLTAPLGDGPALDIGCSVGRSTFELAGRVGGLVVGMDLNFSMLRLARHILTDGEITYARRRIGLVYDRRAFDVPHAGAERIDFWVCNAMALPFPAHRFGALSAMNVLDCVPDPRALLAAFGTILRPGGVGVLATPYDWSNQATHPTGWIGGHSQRGISRGAAEPQLRALLRPQGGTGLRLVAEVADFPWHVRMHDRSTVSYSTHLVAVRAAGDDEPA